MISDGFQEGMPVGFTASECNEADLFSCEINVCPDQTVRPRTVHDKGVAEQTYPTMSISPAQVNNAALGLRLEIELPRAGKQASARRSFDAHSSPLTVGDGILGRMDLQGGKRVEMEALPNFSLPASVETFDSGLEAGFPWRSKDCGHSQAQAKTDHASKGVAKLVGALETGVVVKLDIGRQPKGSPVLNQGLDHRMSEDGPSWPRGNQSSVQRHGIEHFDSNSAFDDQAFDDIEAIQLASSRCHVGQVPAGWRWWMASSIPTIQRTTPLQNAPNGTQCGNRSCPSCDQFPLNGLSSVFSQDAAVLELSPYPNNQVLNTPLGPMNVARSMGSILPIDPGKSFPLSSLHPIMHGGNAYAKASSNPPQRFSLADRAHHRFTSFQLRTFLTKVGFPSFMFLSTIAALFDIIWHSGVRHQVAVTA